MSPTSAARAIATLVDSGHTLRELERLVGLSRGYLSKVRRGAARPSAPLVALLEVLSAHPEALETLRDDKETTTEPAPRGAAVRTLPRARAGARGG